MKTAIIGSLEIFPLHRVIIDREREREREREIERERGREGGRERGWGRDRKTC